MKEIRLKNVVIITRAWYPNHQYLVDELYNKLILKGIKLHYLLLAESEINRPWDKEYGNTTPILLPSFTFSIFNKQIMINNSMCKYLNKLNPDLIILSPWSEYALFQAKYWAKKNSVKCIGWVMGFRVYHWKLSLQFRSFFSHLIINSFTNNLNELFVYGYKIADSFRSFGYTKNKTITVVKHCINEKRFTLSSYFDKIAISKEYRNKLKIKPNKFVFGFIGTLNERKGFDILIKTCVKLWEEENDFCLLVLGNGPMHSQYSNIFTKYSDRITHLPQVSNRDLVKFYASIDCAVVPSRFDDWSTVVNEAYCCYTPVIASYGAWSTGDLIFHNAYAYEPSDHKGLYNSMKHVLMHKSESINIGKKGYDIIHNSWNTDISSDIWCERIVDNLNN